MHYIGNEEYLLRSKGIITLLQYFTLDCIANFGAILSILELIIHMMLAYKAMEAERYHKYERIRDEQLENAYNIIIMNIMYLIIQ